MPIVGRCQRPSFHEHADAQRNEFRAQRSRRPTCPQRKLAYVVQYSDEQRIPLEGPTLRSALSGGCAQRCNLQRSQFYVTMDDEALQAHLIVASIEHMNRRGADDGVGGIEYGMRAVRQLMGMMPPDSGARPP